MKLRQLFSAMAVSAIAVVVAQGSFIVGSHSGQNDPTTEGFAAVGTAPGNGAPVNDGGTDAWTVTSGTTGEELAYRHPLSAGQIASAQANGWTLRSNVRVGAHAGGLNSTVILEARFANEWWMIRWQDRPDLTVFNNAGVVGAGFPYALLELTYDPGAGTAKLFVNGNEELSNLVPGNNSGEYFGFGDGDSGATPEGLGYWNLVEFEIVPEPGTLAMLFAGLCVLSSARRFGR